MMLSHPKLPGRLKEMLRKAIGRGLLHQMTQPNLPAPHIQFHQQLLATRGCCIRSYPVSMKVNVTFGVVWSCGFMLGCMLILYGYGYFFRQTCAVYNRRKTLENLRNMQTRKLILPSHQNIRGSLLQCRFPFS